MQISENTKQKWEKISPAAPVVLAMWADTPIFLQKRCVGKGRFFGKWYF